MGLDSIASSWLEPCITELITSVPHNLQDDRECSMRMMIPFRSFYGRKLFIIMVIIFDSVSLVKLF